MLRDRAGNRRRALRLFLAHYCRADQSVFAHGVRIACAFRGADDPALQRRDAGGQLYIYSLRGPVEELFERGGYIDAIGRENVFRGKREAVGGVFARLDQSICTRCRARIFEECASVPGPQDPR